MKRPVLLFLCAAGLTLGAGATPVRLDPGDVEPGLVTPYHMTLWLEPGALAPLRPMLDAYRIRVQRGDLTLSMGDASEVLHAGDERVVAAGVSFTLRNDGDAAAQVLILASVAVLDAPRDDPAHLMS